MQKQGDLPPRSKFPDISRLGPCKSRTVVMHPETQVQANTALQSRTQTISTSARCSASQVDYLYLRTKIQALQILDTLRTFAGHVRSTCNFHQLCSCCGAALHVHCRFRVGPLRSFPEFPLSFPWVSLWYHFAVLWCAFVVLESVFQSEAEQKFQRPSSPPGGRTLRVLQGLRTDMPVPSQSRWVCQE